MKKSILIVLGVLLCFGLAACTEQKDPPIAPEQSSGQEQTPPQSDTENPELQPTDSQTQESSPSNTGTPETGEWKLKLVIDGQEFDVTLYDTPAANALYDMLPLHLNFEDFNGVEKIAYLDNELPTEGEPDGCDPDIGDLCLYAPWGNLSIFYQDFRYSDSLIILGHIDEGMDIISSMDENTLVILEKVN